MIDKLKQFGIHPKFHAEFQALVKGKRPGEELRTRLKHVKNYRACLDSILAELSAPVLQQHFPPHFESIQ